MLPTDFGPWQTVYWWFRRFVRRRLFRTLHDVALMMDREAMLTSLDRLEMLERSGARIFFGHDPEFWQTVPKGPVPVT